MSLNPLNLFLLSLSLSPPDESPRRLSFLLVTVHVILAGSTKERTCPKAMEKSLWLMGKLRFYTFPQGGLAASLTCHARIAGDTHRAHRWWAPIPVRMQKQIPLTEGEDRERKEPRREGSAGEETLWTLFDLHIWGKFKNVILRSRVGPNAISVTEPN